jgi:catechol 2,3-dioxygenase-like lactoylglutathione lyase family enzyme
MPALRQIVFNVLCKDIPASVQFYTRLAGFMPIEESSWRVVLGQPGSAGAVLALVDQVSEFTPRHAWGTHNGEYLTLIVDDIFATLQIAADMDVELIEEPVSLGTGMTRALIRDPNGLVVELATPTELLALRDDVEFEVSPKTTAIDQQQPEERGRGSTVTP